MLALVKKERLKIHEQISPKYLKKLKGQIRADGVVKIPLVADRKTGVILDGTHRYVALLELGCKKIPVWWVDYSSPQIVVQCWREGESVTKQQVIAAGLSGRPLPPKTSRHMWRTRGGLVHVSKHVKPANIPLEKLR
jgi:hypothetical protein